MQAEPKIVTDPNEELLYAVGSALMGYRVGAHRDGKPIEGVNKPALSIVFMTARKAPDHVMRLIGDLIFSEKGREILPEDLRPVKPEDIILWTIRAGALFGLAGTSQSTREMRLPMEVRLRRSDVQQVAETLLDGLEKLYIDLPGAFPAAFEGQGESMSYEEITRSLRRLTNRNVAIA
jgi:hypothetical protein